MRVFNEVVQLSPNLIVGRALENKVLTHLRLLHMAKLANLVLLWNLMLDLYLKPVRTHLKLAQGYRVCAFSAVMCKGVGR
jgi:hypothetical protein